MEVPENENVAYPVSSKSAAIVMVDADERKLEASCGLHVPQSVSDVKDSFTRGSVPHRGA